MTKVKVVRCQDLEFDCDAIVRSESGEELMAQVPDHVKNVHDVTVTDDIANQIRTKVRNAELEKFTLLYFMQ